VVRHGCARLGVLLTDRFLVYGTGGLAYGRVEHAASYATLPGIGGIFVGPNPFSFVCNGILIACPVRCLGRMDRYGSRVDGALASRCSDMNSRRFIR
jgi:hypothetical protein